MVSYDVSLPPMIHHASFQLGPFASGWHIIEIQPNCHYYHVCKAFVLIFWSWNLVFRSLKSHGKVMEFCPGNFVATLFKVAKYIETN